MTFSFSSSNWSHHKKNKAVTAEQNDSLGVSQTVQYDSGVGEGGSEVVSHHDGLLYITNGEADRIDIVDAATGVLVDTIDLTTIPGYDGVNSVSASDAGIAVAVEIDPAVSPNGVVALYDLDGTPTGLIEVGNLPDMVTFSEDGTQIFVANEGEPTAGGDPAGSISIIDVATMTAQTYDFSEFDAVVNDLRDAGVRIFPGKLPSTDFEPEYISEAGGKLFVTLQEANAVAVFDLASMSWDEILPLGTLDHSVSPLDASDKDDAINIQTYDDLVGQRMPDAIAATEIDGEIYFLTANEGDDRGDYDEGGDAARVGDILAGDVPGVSIDPSVDTTGLERLNISIIDGDTDGDGDIDVLHAYGSRSFTIFDQSGAVVFDSGDDFEQIIAANRVPNAFNNDDFPSDDPNTIDENRSDNKGPEPEAIAVGEVDGKTLAFIGLERDSGIMIYDISDPENAEFVDYIDSSEFGNISPEVIAFIPAEDSATGLAQIAVANEVSGTTSVYDLQFGADIKGTNRGDDIAGTIGDDAIAAGNGKDTVDANGGDDLVEGGNGKDMLFGGAGDDTVNGGNASDALYGGMGEDEINGGAGKDTIEGGLGNDLLTGDAGCDTFVFNEGDGLDEISDFGHSDLIDLTGTGLSYADLTITEVSNNQYTVEYGSMGDQIDVTTTGIFVELNADSFVF